MAPCVNGPEAEKLHDRLANWAAAINPLESGWPAMPDGVTDRRADVWESLVAVADTAGGHWPKPPVQPQKRMQPQIEEPSPA